MGFLIEGNSHQSKLYFLSKSLTLGIYRLSVLFTISELPLAKELEAS